MDVLPSLAVPTTVRPGSLATILAEFRFLLDMASPRMTH